MCYSTPVSFSFALVGFSVATYLLTNNVLKYNYLSLLLYFYSTMELLQGVQYYYVNECGNTINYLLTEFAYILVIVQPFLWNFFYFSNSNNCDKKIFLTGMALSVCWTFVHIFTRLYYTKENGMKYSDSFYATDSNNEKDGVCTKKKKYHLYWQWTSANFYDLNPTMLMYLLIWFVPALLSNKHRNSSFIIIMSFFVALFNSYYYNELFTITSLWCYISVPIVLLVILEIFLKKKYNF